ncbi:MAG: hypothetical protein K9L23_21660 [Desulfotignum sp.]|nr:hypothetical protein [Desulfotignum sp.]
MNKMEYAENYLDSGEKKAIKIIHEPEPRKNIEDANLSVKCAMAKELQKMGMPATAISRLLNIKEHRR